MGSDGDELANHSMENQTVRVPEASVALLLGGLSWFILLRKRS